MEVNFFGFRRTLQDCFGGYQQYLSDAAVRNAKSYGKVQKLSDGGGLYLHVTATGSKLWRMAYRFKGKQKLLSFGAYPAISLKDARHRRDDARESLAKEIDPGADR